MRGSYQPLQGGLVRVMEGSRVKFVHVWSVSVASLSSYNFNDDLYGPSFATVHADAILRWRLLLKPKGGQYTDSNEVYTNALGVFVELLDPSKPVNVTFKCFAVNAMTGDPIELVSDEKEFSSEANTWGSYTSEEELPHNKPERMIDMGLILPKEQILHIGVHLSLPSDAFHLPKSLLEPERVPPSAAAVYQFANVRRAEYPASCSNYQLVSSDKQVFYVHKDVLFCACPYFKTLFGADGAVYRENEINLSIFKDIDSEVMEHVLRFIYTQETSPTIDEVVCEVLDAAEKFGLEELKNICHLTILKVLYKEPLRCLEFLVAADRFDLPYAKRRALCVAVDHWEKIAEQARKQDPLIVEQLTQLAVEKSRVTKSLPTNLYQM